MFGMEKQLEKILEKISNHQAILSYDEHFLDKYFCFSDKKKDFCNTQKICEFLQIKYGFENNDVDLERFIVSIIYTNKNEQKVKLISLLVYLDNKNCVLLKYLFDRKFFDFLKNDSSYIINFLQNNHLYINKQDLLKNTYEYKLYQDYQDGLKTKDFGKIYDFIDGYFNSYNSYSTLQNIYFISYFSYIYFKLSKDNFVKILDKQNDIFNILRFIYRCNNDELLLIVKESKNKLVQFEIVKRLFYKGANNFVMKNHQDIVKTISSFAKDEIIWDNFLKFYLKFPQRNQLLISYLAHIFSKSNIQKYVRDIFIKNINIDIYSDIQRYKILTNCILAIKNQKNKKYILQGIFDKWCDYIKQSNDYILDITTFINVTPLICYYIGNYLDKQTIKEQIREYIAEIQELENKWFSDSLAQTKYFFKLLYQFFVYSAYLNDMDIDMENLLQKYKFLKYQRTSSSNFFQQIKAHFNKLI